MSVAPPLTAVIILMFQIPSHLIADQDQLSKWLLNLFYGIW